MIKSSLIQIHVKFTASSGQSWAISLIQLKKQAGGVARIDLRNTKAMTNTSMSLWF